MTAQKDATLPKPLWMRSWNALPGATKGLYCRPCAPVGSPPPNYLLYLSSNVLQLASEPAVLSPLSALGITTLIPTTPAFFGPFDLLAADFHSFAKALTQQSPNTRLFVLGIGDLANHALMAACVCQHLAAAICIEPDLSLSQSHQGGPIHPTDLLPGQRCPIQIHCTEPTTLQDSPPYELLLY